jgi:hypothetical protein
MRESPHGIVPKSGRGSRTTPEKAMDRGGFQSFEKVSLVIIESRQVA